MFTFFLTKLLYGGTRPLNLTLTSRSPFTLSGCQHSIVMDEANPSFAMRLPTYVPSQGDQTSQRDQRPTNKTAPCLLTKDFSSPPTRSAMANAPASFYCRPNLIRAATATVKAKANGPAIAPPMPLLSRPILNRSATTTRLVRPLLHPPMSSNKPNRPSLLRRATDALVSGLELPPEASHAYKNRPEAPTYWSDHVHRQALLDIWDAVPEMTSTSKYTTLITPQLVSTEKQMLEKSPELAERDELLRRERVEYVLGISLRHPFYTSDKMG